MTKKAKLTALIQESLVCLLCFSNSQRARTIRSLVPSRSFDPYFRKIVEAADEYIKQYKKAPDEHTLDLIEAIKLDEPDNSAIYDKIFQSLIDNKDRINEEYVLSNAALFARAQRAKAVIQKALPILAKGDESAIQEVEALMCSVGRVQADVTDHGILLNDPAEALAFLDKEDGEPLPIGIPELDKHGIGPTRKKYFLTVAPTNVGKSWSAVHKGKVALVNNLRVCHITCEMSADEVAQRYVQSLCSVGLREATTVVRRMKKNEYGRMLELEEEELTRPHLHQANIRKILMEKLKPLSRRPSVFIKEFPSGTCTIDKLKTYLDFLESVHKFIPDVLLVDYPDLFDHDPKHKRVELEKITVDIRGIASERNLAACGYSQASESRSDSKGPVRTGRAAESRSKEHTADIVLTLNQTEAEYQLGLLRVNVAKARSSVKCFQVLLTQALNIGQFVMDSALMNQKQYWAMVGASESDSDEPGEDEDE